MKSVATHAGVLVCVCSWIESDRDDHQSDQMKGHMKAHEEEHHYKSALEHQTKLSPRPSPRSEKGKAFDPSGETTRNVAEFKEANEDFQHEFTSGDLKAPPARKMAVVTCMDARLHPEAFLGFGFGDSHMIRNAGGRISDDALRSLVISQRMLGTEEVVVIHHTDCGKFIRLQSFVYIIHAFQRDGDLNTHTNLVFPEQSVMCIPDGKSAPIT